MIFEISLVIVTIIVTGVLVITSFKTGFRLGSEREIAPVYKPETVAEIDFEEGDPLNG